MTNTFTATYDTGGCYVIKNGVVINFYGYDELWKGDEKTITLTRSQGGKIVDRAVINFTHNDCKPGIKATLSFPGTIFDVPCSFSSVDFVRPGTTKPGPLVTIREGTPPENKNLKGEK